MPDAPPNGITWQIIDTVALPFSDSAGPSQVTEGIPSGFAHTPTGALVALVQIDFRHLIEPNFVAVTTADVANTAGRAEFFRLVKAGRLANPAHPAPGTYLQLAGFEFVSYTSSNAVIQLLTARTRRHVPGQHAQCRLGRHRLAARAATQWHRLSQPTDRGLAGRLCALGGCLMSIISTACSVAGPICSVVGDATGAAAGAVGGGILNSIASAFSSG